MWLPFRQRQRSNNRICQQADEAIQIPLHSIGKPHLHDISNIVPHSYIYRYPEPVISNIYASTLSYMSAPYKCTDNNF